MPEEKRVITLMTDFGYSDYYVGAMKGVILSVHSDVHIVDITHGIAPYDFIGAAFNLMAYYNEFPRWTVHVVVIDPGVGTQRRPILVVGDKHFFIGPDNGVFSLIYEREEWIRVYHLTEEHFFRSTMSSTFHGRDIFAPAAAWLAKGVEPSHMGQIIEDYMKIPFPKPVQQDTNVAKGIVLYVDRFGNCITNFDTEFLQNFLGEDFSKQTQIIIKDTRIGGIRRTFAEVEKGTPLAYIGSSGYLEIGINQGNAAQVLQIRRGEQVTIITAR